MENLGWFTLFTSVIAFVALLFAAWATHVAWWISLCMTEQMDTLGEAVLAILGTLVPPIGVLHGLILWF